MFLLVNPAQSEKANETKVISNQMLELGVGFIIDWKK